MKQNLLTVGTVARELKVSRWRIHQMLNEKPVSRFPSAFQLDGGQWLIDAKDLAANRIRKPGRPKSKK